MLDQRIQQQFFDSADLQVAAAETLARPIVDAVQAIVAAITSGSKVMACGNGGSASLARYFAAVFIGRFERERPGLAAIALSPDSALPAPADGEDGSASICGKQVEALGQPGDVLLAISTSGNSADVLAAVEAAHGREMVVVALTGRGGGRIGQRLTETDIHVCVPHERSIRIQEVHLLTIHCICDAVDLQLLGESDKP